MMGLKQERSFPSWNISRSELDNFRPFFQLSVLICKVTTHGTIEIGQYLSLASILSPDRNMSMSQPIIIAKSTDTEAVDCAILPQMANRHGLIAGATGTGKTVTLQAIVQQFSQQGVPVFMADIKGDLTGISQPGSDKPKITERLQLLGIEGFNYTGCPVQLWDVFGEQGLPLRATISEMGPLLLSRMLNLNDTQSGVLNIAFQVADDNGLLLLDLKDLRAMIQYLGENAKEFKTEYGNISAASVGAIQRNLLVLEQQGADRFFGEPALNLMDLIQTDAQGNGIVNILAADKLMQSPQLYATFLLWLLSELFEQLPEAGDLVKPKMLFFFDEAHLLFDDAPEVLQDKIEQVVRLIRSKGVGVYFCSQNPMDIPPKILGQLGNRVQHALRAFTPQDQKAVKAAATTFRVNPDLDVATAITELGMGEVLISCLDEQAAPGIVQRAWVMPPASQLGPITPEQRQELIQGSILHSTYAQSEDRESAYEMLKQKAAETIAQAEAQAETQAAEKAAAKQAVLEQKQAEQAAEREAVQQERREAQSMARSEREREKMLVDLAGHAGHALAGSMGKSIARGLLGSILGGR
jgi:uncharacterized protein